MDNKVLGLPADKYTKICYGLILIASGFGVFTNLLGFVGVAVPGGILTGLLGLAGIILAMLGLFVFKDKLTPLDLSHFKYIGIIFVVFFVVYAVIVNALVGMGYVGMVIIILISIVQFILLLAGYKLFESGVTPSKDSVTQKIKSKFKN